MGTPPGIAWLLILVTLASCGVVGGGESDAPEARLALKDRLADAPTGFGFSYQARGTRVLDCVLPNRSFDGRVFPGGAFVLDAETPAGAARALSLDDAVYLDDAFFAQGTVAAEWVRLTRLGLDAARPSLDRILGVDLAAYLAAPGSPPSGNQIVAATLERTVVDSRLGPIRAPGGAAAAGYRFVVEGEDPVPVIDGWVDGEGRVVRVQVQDSIADEPGEPNPDTGWIIDYKALPPGATAPAPPGDFVEATSGVLADLAPPMRDGCELEIGPAPTAPRPQP